MLFYLPNMAIRSLLGRTWLLKDPKQREVPRFNEQRVKLCFFRGNARVAEEEDLSNSNMWGRDRGWLN